MKYATRERNYLVDALAVIFGIGSWIAVNGVWVELPVLVNALPEMWNLPSYLTVITQAANIGPIIYGFLHKFSPRIINETSSTIVIMTIGVISCFLLAFFWNSTVSMAGGCHSLAFFILVFFVAIVDCTSSVVFLPFMGFFKDIYLVSFFVGEGLSGFLPSIVALAQGVGGNPSCQNQTIFNGTINITEIVQVTPTPNFSSQVFFFVLCGMMVVSFLSFALLRFHPTTSNERVQNFKKMNSSISTLCDKDNEIYENLSRNGSVSASSDSGNLSTMTQYGTGNTDVAVEKILDRSTYLVLLSIQAWVSCLQNGILLSVQSYSCLPYGNVAYHLTVTLSNIAAPLASFITFFLPVHQMWIIMCETTISSLIGAYILALAATSPSPPLVNTTSGTALVVIAWILFTGFVSHLKASLGIVFKTKSKRALFWCGAVNQIGSAIGAIIMFLLVNVYTLFKSYDPCSS